MTSAASPWKVKASSGGSGGEARDPAPEGVHQARLVALVDLGSHDEAYQGKPKVVRKVFLAWELLGVPVPGGTTPYVLGQDYTVMEDRDGQFKIGDLSNLRKAVKGMRGKDLAEGEDYELTRLLGQPCQLQVAQHQSKANKERRYAKIEVIMALPGALHKAAPQAQHKPLLWGVGDDLAVLEKADWLPFIYGEPVLEVVKRCHQLGGRKAAPAGGAAGAPPPEQDQDQGSEEDIPF